MCHHLSLIMYTYTFFVFCFLGSALESFSANSPVRMYVCKSFFFPFGSALGSFSANSPVRYPPSSRPSRYEGTA